MPFPARLYSYLTLGLVLAAGFVVVTTFAFVHTTADDIGLVAAIALMTVSAAACLIRVGPVQRAAVVACFALSAWTILVTAGLFAGATQRWMTFASAVAIVVLATAAQVIAVRASELRAVRPAPTATAT